MGMIVNSPGEARENFSLLRLIFRLIRALLHLTGKNIEG